MQQEICTQPARAHTFTLQIFLARHQFQFYRKWSDATDSEKKSRFSIEASFSVWAGARAIVFSGVRFLARPHVVIHRWQVWRETILANMKLELLIKWWNLVSSKKSTGVHSEDLHQNAAKYSGHKIEGKNVIILPALISIIVQNEASQFFKYIFWRRFVIQPAIRHIKFWYTIGHRAYEYEAVRWIEEFPATCTL